MANKMYAVFCVRKNHNRAVDPPCLDPLDFGIDNEPDREQLLRRGRVALFATRGEAENHLLRTCELCRDKPWVKSFSFLILECHDRTVGHKSNT